jgi:predicted ATPase
VRLDGRSASPAKREGAGPNCSRAGQLRPWGFQRWPLALHADAQLAIGKPEAALESVAAGLKAVEKTGGAPLEAELYRLRGEAETAMQQGIDVARRQNAKSWELRGAMSLARLRRQQGRPQEAPALLAPILGWFTEEFDTADLQAARTLLAEIASSLRSSQ